MKNIFIILSVVLIPLIIHAQRINKNVTCHISNVSFSEFCKVVSQQAGIHIYFNEQQLQNLTVTLDADSIPVEAAVSKVLEGSGFEVSAWHGDMVILPKVKLIAALPEYTSKLVKDAQAKPSTNSAGNEEEQYLSVRKASIPTTLTIGKKGTNVPGSKAKITGIIHDEETGEPIYNATVFVIETKTGAVTDVGGTLNILLEPGTYSANFECLGYERKNFHLEVLSDGNFSVTLKKSVIQMKEVEVFGDRQMNIRSKDPGLEKLTIKTIRELPMMMGERDILKVSGTMPGIVSVGEGSAGLNVRGGGSDQNAFYINKIPIYNTSHLFGFFPAFNADIIKDFSIYKGFIPAQYGGHISSVFNIVTRQGNRKRLTARGGISPITANLVVEGPLKKDTCSFMLSIRSSYSDWILKKIKDIDIKNSSAGFNDFSAGLNYDLRKTQLSIFFYNSYDRFRLSDLTTYSYANHGASASLSRNFGKTFRAELSIIGSQYEFSTIDKQDGPNAYEHSYKMEHYETRIDFKQQPNDKHSLEYGVDAILYQLDRGTVAPYGNYSLRKITDLGKEQGLESSIYISDAYDITSWLNLTGCLRYTLFTPLGQKTVYLYEPGKAIDAETITDSLIFDSNKSICRYHEPDIRLALNIETDGSGSVKLAFNQMHQNLFLLNTTTAISPNTQWKLADYHLNPSASNQFSVGVFRTLAKYKLETSAEFFYKYTNKYSEFKDGADFLNNPLVETSVLQGKQQAWGAEFFVKRNMHKLEGWISYTYSRSIVKVNGNEEWDRINGGEAYPASFDIPHVLNMVLNYHLSKRVTFSSIFTYQRGKPVTYPVSVYYVDGIQVLEYSKRNAYRIPDYIRTDFSVTVEGNLKKRKLAHSSFIFSLYNAFGRDNPYSVYYKMVNGFVHGYQYSVIGVPIFTATWSFKLGNYEAE